MMAELNRYTFEVWHKNSLVHTHTLVVNPTDLTQNEPARVTVVNTFGGVHVDDFGLGVKSSNLKGTTGWRSKMLNGVKVSGVEAFIALRQDVYRYFLEPNKGVRKDSNKVEYELKYFKWDTNEFYVIQPYDFQLQQSSREALLYRYDFSFYMLREIGAPKNVKSTIIPPNSLSVLYSKLQQALNNMRLLMDDDKAASIDMFSLDESEVVSYKNFPEFFELGSKMPDKTNAGKSIKSILTPIWDTGDQLCQAILMENELGYLDISKASLDSVVDDFLVIVEVASRLAKIPFYMLVNMRAALDCMKQVSNSGMIFRG